MIYLETFLAAAGQDPHPMEMVVTVRDLVYFGVVFAVVVGVVVEARIRIAMLWTKTKALEVAHNECSERQRIRYDEIKELLHGLKTQNALICQRVNILVKNGGGTVPDDEEEE